MYLRKSLSRGKEYYQICEVKENKVVVLQHLGSVEGILKKFQYIAELENNVSLLKKAISQYGEGLNQVWDQVDNKLKSNDIK